MQLYAYNRKFGKFAYGQTIEDLFKICKAKTCYRMRIKTEGNLWEIWTSFNREEILSGKHGELKQIIAV